MSQFEGKAAVRTQLEKLVTALSIRTVNVHQASGGRPQLETCHWAAMLSGLSSDDRWLKRTAEYLLHYAYLHDDQYRKPLEDAMFAHLTNRIMLEHPDLKVSGKDIRAVVRVGMQAERAGGTVTQADAGRAGIGRDRWKSLQPVYAVFLSRVAEAEQALIWHIKRKCG